MKMRSVSGRGQSGIELIVGVALILVVFLIVVLMVMDKTAETSRVKSLIDAQRVGVSMRDNINMINDEGPGYYAYVSIPERIHGGYEYDIIARNNVLEIVWEDNAWTTKVIPTNVTIYCLDKGYTLKNRIFYGSEGIEVTCNRPNLRVVPHTVVRTPGKTTIDVVNDAHVDAGIFRTRFQTNSTPSTSFAVTAGLAAGDTTTLEFNLQANNFTYFAVDYLGDVNESIESDNGMNETLS
ncbi:MAG: hypothetical protein V1875_02380 [Candidatus Altiarchaeota archaeon]